MHWFINNKFFHYATEFEIMRTDVNGGAQYKLISDHLLTISKYSNRDNITTPIKVIPGATKLACRPPPEGFGLLVVLDIGDDMLVGVNFNIFADVMTAFRFTVPAPIETFDC